MTIYAFTTQIYLSYLLCDYQLESQSMFMAYLFLKISSHFKILGESLPF